MTEFDKVIPPGGVGKVTASLDTSHYRGPISKSVTVRTVGPEPALVVLELKALVVSPVDVAPSDTPVIRMNAGEATPTKLTVSASDDRPFAILAVQADPAVTVSVALPEGVSPKKKTRRPPKALVAGSSRYVVSIVPKADLPPGQTVANVTLTTDLPKAGTVPIRATLLVVGPVRVVPDRMILRPAAQVPVFHARITKPGGAPLRILSVESSDADFSATTSPIRDGREYDLAVTYTGKPARGFINARITLKTDDPLQQTLIVPLVGQL